MYVEAKEEEQGSVLMDGHGWRMRLWRRRWSVEVVVDERRRLVWGEGRLNNSWEGLLGCRLIFVPFTKSTKVQQGECNSVD